MCGIAGLVARPGAALPSPDRSRAVAAALHHRGPDDAGEWHSGNTWFRHARLSILDVSSAGHQPMTSADGQCTICYNGEVYNFGALAQHYGLSSLRSHSDTEVLLEAWRREGPASVVRFNGIFAFAMHDPAAGAVWLVRDRLGIKPLYWWASPHGVAFASELEALFAVTGERPPADATALPEWAWYGQSLGARTLYRGVQKLLPGHILRVDLRTLEVTTSRYWSAADVPRASAEARAVTARIATTRQMLHAAVERQLVSDVPVGVFLSGGVDSSALTAFAARAYGASLATYSVGFDFAGAVDERPVAKRLAAHFGTQHHELEVHTRDLADITARLVAHHGLPFSDAANVPLWLLAEQVKPSVSVVLQGDGGDELFGGYRRYRTLTRIGWWRAAATVGLPVLRQLPLTPSVRRALRYLGAVAPADPAMRMALLLTEDGLDEPPTRYFGEALRAQMSAVDPFARYRECQADTTHADPVQQMFIVDARVILADLFLEKVDRATMAWGLEARVPFLDAELVDWALSLSGPEKVPDGQQKWLLKQALAGVVPDDVLRAPKTGFGVPYGQWLRTALRTPFLDLLATMQRQHPGVLDVPALSADFEAHVSGAMPRPWPLWKFYNFMLWATQGVRFA
jgi:asparagine synthase (glutamine-hydrolysing)